MFQRILVPLDGSPRAEHAISVAIRIARSTGATIALLRVIPPAIVYGAYTPDHVVQQSYEVHSAEANRYLLQVANAYSRAGVSIQTKILSGPVALTILDFARSCLFDLVIINSHGFTGFTRLMLGSVSEEVAYSSPRPVLVLRDEESRATNLPAYSSRPLHTLVTLDGSTLPETILLPALRLSIALSASSTCVLHLLQVISPSSTSSTRKNQPLAEKDKAALEQAKQAAETSLNKVANRLRGGEWTELAFTVTSSVVVDANATAGIIAEIEKAEARQGSEAFEGYDLVAIATHGRGDLQRLVTLSVIERILQATKLPLLIVRATEEQAGIM